MAQIYEGMKTLYDEKKKKNIKYILKFLNLLYEIFFCLMG